MSAGEREYQRAEEFMLDDAEYVLVAYGMPARVCKYAANELRKEGLKVGVLRPKVLYHLPQGLLPEAGLLQGQSFHRHRDGNTGSDV